MPLYGPPPDPAQQLVPLDLASEPVGWALSLAFALAFVGLACVRRLPAGLRALSLCLGLSAGLTAPFLGLSQRYVIGSWPTIDKTGSLLFYLEGVHRTLTFHPIAAIGDPAARLIGVHVGHLWITALLDLFVEPFAAFNLHGLLNVALGWWAAALLMRELWGRWDSALVAAFPFGMGLHVFRDLNWYTIEKSSVLWLALFAWALARAWRGGRYGALVAGLLYASTAFVNWYLALVGAAGAALLLLCQVLGRGLRDPGTRRLAWACAACVLAVSPLLALQMALLHGPQTLGDPELFLRERAALDSFSLSPARWNRLEIYRALNLPLLALGLLSLLQQRRDGRALSLGVVAALLFALSLGPSLGPELQNPLYMAVHRAIPGFWRVAKPEVFFEGSYLALLCLAGLGLSRLAPPGRALWLLPILAAGWLLVVRSHPVYPPMSRFVPTQLAPEWQRALPGRQNVDQPAQNAP